MNDLLNPTFIAIGVSLLGVIFSFFGTWIANKNNRIKLFREIESEYSLYLFKERLESYGTAFKITGKIQRQKKPKFINNKDELSSIADELESWTSGKGGLLMSGSSLKTCRDLKNSLKMGPSNNDLFTQEQAEKIWNYKIKLRQLLRKDLSFHVPNKQFKKKI